MRLSKRIISFVTVFATLVSLLTVSASAAENPQPSSFVEWGYAYSTAFADTMQSVLVDECPEADDGNHDAASYLQDLDGVYFLCSCARCGQNFIGVAFGDGYVSDGSYNLAGGGASRADVLAAAYDTYVSELPQTICDSEGTVYWTPEVSALDIYVGSWYSFEPVLGQVMVAEESHDYNTWYSYLKFSFADTCPVNGSYYLPAFTSCSSNGSLGVARKVGEYSLYYQQNSSSDLVGESGYQLGYTHADSATFYTKGSDFVASKNVQICFGWNVYYLVEWLLNSYPTVKIAPSLDADKYGLDQTQSRPTSITGNYGIVGDDGSVTNIGTQTIVNEGSSTYYNPVTNTSYELSGWTYDYSTRTYDLSTTEGDTITVEYGDETVNITEGDTVYNIYYLVEEDTSSGDDEDSSGSTGDEDCDHTYTSETTKAATCLLSGKETFTCSECGDTYTKTIPATGHDWSVLQSVTSQYDDTGALVTEGYTIYQCAACGEQYKSTDGSAPPGGSSSSGGTIWEKIGTLFGTIADGVIGMIETALSTLLDGLISLATVISEKGQRVIELILGFFEKIPELFGAFPDFLGAVFPFIPEDLWLILEFGLAAVVFAAIIKFIKKG